MVSNHDGTIVYFDEEQSPVLFSKAKPNAVKPTNLPLSQEEDSDSTPIAFWGEENNFPIKARLEKTSNPDLISALDWKARALYGGGLKYQIRDRITKTALDADTIAKDSKLRSRIYEIDQFQFRNRHYLLKAVVDFYDLFNVFPQIILSEDRQKIERIAVQEARYCRYQKKNKAGIVENVYLHPEWEKWSNDLKDKKLTAIPCLDPLNLFPDDLKDRRGDTLSYIYPLSYPTGKNYYQLVHWWSVKVSGWLDFGAMIPEVKASILRNLALIRYHIEMPDYWMTERYKTWHSMSDGDRLKATQKEFKIINDVLVGARNAGKSIFTVFKTITSTGQPFAGWKITAIDDKMKDGALLADSSEATIKIFSGTSIDPALHGLIPGKGGSNRSGSDKREALNIYMSLITAHEDIICDPWNYASWHNGWNDADTEVVWYLNKPYLQTLNQVPPSQRSTIIPDDHAD